MRSEEINKLLSVREIEAYDASGTRIENISEIRIELEVIDNAELVKYLNRKRGESQDAPFSLHLTSF